MELSKKEDFKGRAFKLLAFSALTMKTTKNNLHSRLEAKKLKITLPSVIVLHHINNGPNTIKLLSEHMLISSPTLVPVIDLLEKKGFLKRVKNKQDRRENLLELTNKGKLLIKEVPLIDESGAIMKSLMLLGEKKSNELLKLYFEFIRNLEDTCVDSKKIHEYMKRFKENNN